MQQQVLIKLKDDGKFHIFNNGIEHTTEDYSGATKVVIDILRDIHISDCVSKFKGKEI